MRVLGSVFSFRWGIGRVCFSQRKTCSVTLRAIRDPRLCGGRFFGPRRHGIYFVTTTHVRAKFALLLLHAKSLVCAGCSFASWGAAPSPHWQLFAEKGKGFDSLKAQLFYLSSISSPRLMGQGGAWVLRFCFSELVCGLDEGLTPGSFCRRGQRLFCLADGAFAAESGGERPVPQRFWRCL